MSTSLVGTLEEAISGIGEHAGRGVYRILSLNASKYSITLVLLTDGTQDELGRVLAELQKKMMVSTFEQILGLELGEGW